MYFGLIFDFFIFFVIVEIDDITEPNDILSEEVFFID